MPQYSLVNQEYQHERIKELLVTNPNISLKGLQDKLESEHPPVRLSIPYLHKLRNKIMRSRQFAYKNVDILTRLGEMLQTKREALKRLWVEAEYGEKSKDRTAALKAIMDIETSMLQAEMDAGLYERKLGTVELEERRLKLHAIIQALEPHDREKILNRLDAHLHGGGNESDPLSLPSADAHRARDIPVHATSERPSVATGEGALGVESTTQ